MLLLPLIFWGSGRGREVVRGDDSGEGDAVRGAPAGMASLSHSAGLNTINAALSFLERNKIAHLNAWVCLNRRLWDAGVEGV